MDEIIELIKNVQMTNETVRGITERVDQLATSIAKLCKEIAGQDLRITGIIDEQECLHGWIQELQNEVDKFNEPDASLVDPLTLIMNDN